MGGDGLYRHHGRQPVAERVDGFRLRPTSGLYPDPGSVHRRRRGLRLQRQYRDADHRANHAGLFRRHHSTPGDGDDYFRVSGQSPWIRHGALWHGGDVVAQPGSHGRRPNHRRDDLATHFPGADAAGGHRLRHGDYVHAGEEIFPPPAGIRLDRVRLAWTGAGLPDDRHRQRAALGLGIRRHPGPVHCRRHHRRRLHLLAGPRQGAAA